MSLFLFEVFRYLDVVFAVWKCQHPVGLPFGGLYLLKNLQEALCGGSKYVDKVCCLHFVVVSVLLLQQAFRPDSKEMSGGARFEVLYPRLDWVFSGIHDVIQNRRNHWTENPTYSKV